MTSPALLLLAACALAAPLYAATIPESADLQKKIPAALPDDIKDPLPTNHEIITPELIKEAGNELHAKPEDIPVEVVVDDAEPSVKINEVDDEETKRPAIDLRNPGPPQRQEHETQNPERHSDEELKVSTIKENIEQAQKLLRQSFQDVSDNIQNWFYKTNDQNKIHENIQNLRDTFTSQIQKLNDTIQVLVKPETSEPVESQGVESQSNYEKIQSRLKILENNFNSEVDTFSAGVELVDSLRSNAGEGDAFKEEAPTQSGSGSNTTGTPIFAIITQGFNNIRDQIVVGVQNLLPGQQTNVQADTPQTSTESIFPFLGQNNAFQFITNLFNQTQSAILGPFQFNLFNRPSATVKPPETATSAAPVKPAEKPAEAAAEKPAEAAAEKPADALETPAAAPAPAPAAPAPAPAVQPAAAQPDAGGPIRQFLNSIPVVQRIQNSLTNRDTPRDPTKNDGQSKGGWYGPPRKPAGSGDNNDSGVIEQKLKEVKEDIKEEPVKEEPVKTESIKEESVKEEFLEKIEAEVKPEVVPEKTE